MKKFTNQKFRTLVILFTILLQFGSFINASGNNSYSNRQDEKTITGVVVDESGISMPGTTVMIPGTTIGTITDMDGKFSLNVPSDTKVILIQSIGYTSIEIDISNTNHIEVTLEANFTELDAVVVTGYGQTQNQELITSSITMIDAEVLVGDKPTARLEQAIQGQSPAVVVIKESGSPGATQTIRIRGVGTAGDATPLMLLDGFQLPDMNFINPNDIADVGVYKDAAASAIYGARGGNGVLNIQSKNGDNKKKVKVNYSGYYGVQSLASEGDYLNSQEYAEYYNATIDYMVREGTLPQDLNRGKYTDEELNLLPNTTWIREVTEDASITDHHLSVLGGNEHINYYLGTGYFDQGGLISKTGFNRKSVLLKLNTGYKDIIDFSILGNYAKNTRGFIPENSENSRLLSSVASIPSIYPAYADNGDPFNNGIREEGFGYNGVLLDPLPEFGNPVVGLKHGTNESISDIYFTNALLGVKIIDGLKFNTSLGYLSQKTFVKQFYEKFEYPEQQIRSDFNSLTETNYEQTFSQWEAYFSYDKQFGLNYISAVVGHSLLKNTYKFYGQSGRDFTENNFDNAGFDNIENDSSIVDLQDREEINTTVSYYARANYNFDKRYMFGLTLRADASSKFSPDNKWGTFPSVDFGWNISNESFLESSDFIDLLKLRASWGINGNDKIPAYQHYDRYEIQNSGNYSKQDYNEEIKWEEITQTNIGLDVDFWRNIMGLSFDYYVKETKDMLIPFPNPSYTGLPAPWRNAADVRNQGFEFYLSYKQVFGDFTIDVKGNFGINKNEVTSLGGGLPLYGANTRVFAGAPDLSKSDVGDPIASFYGFKFEGLDDSGNPVYQDISGPDGVPDGEVTAEYDRTVIGNPYPEFIYGLTIKLEYKGFDLTAFASGVEGNDVVNASTGYHVQYSNRTNRVLDAWSLENSSSEVMRPSALEVTNHEFSDYYIEDGSYMRLKNVTLGYTFSKSILEKIHMSNLRLYVSANNLVTYTKYSGFDPEIGVNQDPRDIGIDRGFYPQAKSIIGGLQVSF